MSGPDAAAAHVPPFLTVVRGEPTEEELAALVVALAARGDAESTVPPPPLRRGWASYADAVKAPLHPGPGAWVASARPR